MGKGGKEISCYGGLKEDKTTTDEEIEEAQSRSQKSSLKKRDNWEDKQGERNVKNCPCRPFVYATNLIEGGEGGAQVSLALAADHGGGRGEEASRVRKGSG